MRRMHPVLLVAALVLAATVLLEARQLWTSSASGTSTNGTMHVGGVVTAGSGPTTLTNGTGQVLEAAIADGSVLARVGSTETVTGAWTFDSAASISPTVIADAAALGLRVRGRSSDSLGILTFQNNAGSGTHGQVRGDSGQLRLYAGTTPTNVLDMSGTAITARVPMSNTSRYNSASAQPGFLAYNSAPDNGQTAGATVDFDTEVLDETNDFAADTFTAPVSGRYRFCSTVSVTSTDVTSITLVTSGLDYELGGTVAVTALPIGGCETVPLSTSETAHIVVGVASGTVDVGGGAGPGTRFSGRLVP